MSLRWNYRTTPTIIEYIYINIMICVVLRPIQI